MNNDKIEELSKRTVQLLEKTKKQRNLYEMERKQLYDYFIKRENIEEWEKYIVKLEELTKNDL